MANFIVLKYFALFGIILIGTITVYVLFDYDSNIRQLQMRKVFLAVAAIPVAEGYYL